MHSIFTYKKSESTILMTILSAAIFLHAGLVKGQKNGSVYRLGTSLETSISFDGHGGFYSAFIMANDEKNSFKLGPMIQRRFTQVNGVRISYSHLLTGLSRRLVYADEIRAVEGPFRLNFFSYLQYVHRAHLSYNATRVELKMNPENLTDWNSVKLSTVEGAIGFELETRVSERFAVRTYLGLNVYYHTNYSDGMYHEKAAPSLVFGAGIDIPRF